jgi:dihydrofolate synthase / folylpolyglutamate synthase
MQAGVDPGVEVLARGAYQRRNFALARAAAEAYLGELDADAVRAAGAETLVPGRFEVVAHEPDTIVDGAHNPGGIAALVEALEDFVDGRRLVACVSILDDKDAAGMLRELLPLCAEVVCTTNASPRALPPATLRSLCHQLGGPPTRTVADPQRALREARAVAGPDGVALATGSIYLIADLLRPAGAERRSTL